ncbi:MAG: GtrA family protein [Prevotella sp.]|jgi:putative flippase GtrA|nr:GtrA family protein [Prevotella sp.]
MGRLRREVWTFCKAQLSAQVATLVDFSVSFILAAGMGVWYVTASFLGALSGGIVNCAVNYRWVFRAGMLKKRYVVLKYFVVWTGSILLNTLGTHLLTEWTGQYFIFPKMVVAVSIALLWNYPMQRVFVYRDNRMNERLGQFKEHRKQTEKNEL